VDGTTAYNERGKQERKQTQETGGLLAGKTRQPLRGKGAGARGERKEERKGDAG
jgi:hypothetical protein